MRSCVLDSAGFLYRCFLGVSERTLICFEYAAPLIGDLPYGGSFGVSCYHALFQMAGIEYLSVLSVDQLYPGGPKAPNQCSSVVESHETEAVVERVQLQGR